MDTGIAPFLTVVLSLLVLEILLSVDNALVNVSIARNLPESKQAAAVRYGIIFAAAFRVVALLLASLIIHNTWLKIIGGLYLVYLLSKHLGRGEELEKTKSPKKPTFRNIVIQIALTDIIFSIDNVISAVGISTNIKYVIAGVLIGIVAILLMSRLIIRLVDKYPHLADAGYIIVGFIGFSMLAAEILDWHMNSNLKFLVIVVITIITLLYERNKKFHHWLKPTMSYIRPILGYPVKAFDRARR